MKELPNSQLCMYEAYPGGIDSLAPRNAPSVQQPLLDEVSLTAAIQAAITVGVERGVAAAMSCISKSELPLHDLYFEASTKF